MNTTGSGSDGQSRGIDVENGRSDRASGHVACEFLHAGRVLSTIVDHRGQSRRPSYPPRGSFMKNAGWAVLVFLGAIILLAMRAAKGAAGATIGQPPNGTTGSRVPTVPWEYGDRDGFAFRGGGWGIYRTNRSTGEVVGSDGQGRGYYAWGAPNYSGPQPTWPSGRPVQTGDSSQVPEQEPEEEQSAWSEFWEEVWSGVAEEM